MEVGSMENGDGAKILSMACLGLGSLIAGSIPTAISDRNRRRFPLSTSLMLCFGAGILLATSLIHMLPDVRKGMPNNAELYLCVGFFVVYFIDEFIHYFFGEAIQHSHPQSQSLDRPSHHSHENRDSYGSNQESDPLIRPNTELQCDAVTRQANERICHTSHQEPCAQTMTGTFGLFIALSLHSFIEGLAIGVQNSPAKVIFLLGAVSCHKFVMAFCLGLEFRSNSSMTIRSQILAILTFSMGSVLGIGVGMAVVDIPSAWSNTALPITQALAGGTLFYVTVCEVIPREKARWHQNHQRKFAGLLQFSAVCIGFTIMTIINYFMDDD